jgi:hypothetical protein
MMVLLQLFEHVKEEYRKVEAEVGLPLADILHQKGEPAEVTPLRRDD